MLMVLDLIIKWGLEIMKFKLKIQDQNIQLVQNKYKLIMLMFSLRFCIIHKEKLDFFQIMLRKKLNLKAFYYEFINFNCY
jgi:hypothetical protein